jgi:hypothetical protein
MANVSIPIWKAVACSDKPLSASELLGTGCTGPMELREGEAGFLEFACRASDDSCRSLDLANAQQASPNVVQVATQAAQQLAPTIPDFLQRYPLLYVVELDSRSSAPQGSPKTIARAVVTSVSSALRFNPAASQATFTVQPMLIEELAKMQSTRRRYLSMPPPAIEATLEVASEMNDQPTTRQVSVPLWMRLDAQAMGAWMDTLGQSDGMQLGFKANDPVVQTLYISGAKQAFSRRVWARTQVRERVAGVQVVDIPSFSPLIDLTDKRAMDLVLGAADGIMPRIRMEYRMERSPPSPAPGVASEASESSSSGLRWWHILLIVLGVLFVLFFASVLFGGPPARYDAYQPPPARPVPGEINEVPRQYGGGIYELPPQGEIRQRRAPPSMIEEVGRSDSDRSIASV